MADTDAPTTDDVASQPPRPRRRSASRPAGPPPVVEIATPEPAAQAEPMIIEAALIEPAEVAQPQRTPRKRASRPAGAPAAVPVVVETPVVPEPVDETPDVPEPADETPVPDESAEETPSVEEVVAEAIEAVTTPEVDAAAPVVDEPESSDAPAAEAPKPARRRRATRPAAAPEPVQASETAATDAESSDAEPADEVAASLAKLQQSRPSRERAKDADVDVASALNELVAAISGAPAETDEAENADEDETSETEDSAENGSATETEEEAAARRRRRRRGGRRRRRSTSDHAPSGEASETEESDADTEDAGSAEQDEQPEHAERPVKQPKPAKPAKPQQDEGADDASEDDSDDAADREEGASGDGTAHRRRRRRRRGEDTGEDPVEDGVDVVVKVREPRKKSTNDEITGIEGSTRMEAKRQRRREGRAAGRRRAPILSESEFLARRESVERLMVIRQSEAYTQIGVIEDGNLVEHYVDRDSSASLIGNIYLGRVQNVLPSMEAAFIDIGRGRNAVLYAGEVDWDSFGVTGQDRKVEKVLKSGQAVLVQVTKDPVGAKGARLTSHISIPGRYVVYSPGGQLSGISRKLPESERARLKGILDSLIGDEASVIVRTAAEGASEEELVRDVNRLKAQWEVIEKKVAQGNSPQMLYTEPDLTVRIVRDLFTEDFTKLIVDGNGGPDDVYETVKSYVEHVAPHLEDRLVKWNRWTQGDLFAEYRVDEQISKALERKVHLPSGGSLVIDRTEAMTVIDVNTGKFTGTQGNLEATVTSNNLEAAEEIVRQLRLRDIGGIIVVDFIDMVLPANRELLLRRLVECLGRDRTRHQVTEVTSLGLVQMTRKKIGTGLAEAFTVPCETCAGRGYHVHDAPVASQAPSDGGDRDSHRGSNNGRRNNNRRSSGKSDRPAEDKPADKASAEKPVADKAEAASDKPASEQAPADKQPVKPSRSRSKAAPKPAAPHADGAPAEPSAVESTEVPAEAAEAPTAEKRPSTRSRSRGSSRKPKTVVTEEAAGDAETTPAEAPAEATPSTEQVAPVEQTAPRQTDAPVELSAPVEPKATEQAAPAASDEVASNPADAASEPAEASE